jgi:uncharacterized protein (TIGR01319 family)
MAGQGVVLCADVGSTYTKVLVVRAADAELVGRGVAPTTVSNDVMHGFELACSRALADVGAAEVTGCVASSSAAGGLRIATVGFVRNLTAEAARRAALGAGGRVVCGFANRITYDDVESLRLQRPDIILLTGGTNGGDEATIRHNGNMLAELAPTVPVIVAGNRAASHDLERVLRDAGCTVYVTPNLMPELGVLDTEPVQELVREIFLREIVQAKGLGRLEKWVGASLLPTPLAVMRGAELVAAAGLSGGVLVVDVGGATTDVVSVLRGEAPPPSGESGALPEARIRRTVEADLGLRVSVRSLVESPQAASLLSSLEPSQVVAMTDRFAAKPEAVAEADAETRFECALVEAAVSQAVSRHAGRHETVWPARGKPFVVTIGRDVSELRDVIVTGGYFYHGGAAALDPVARALQTARENGSLVTESPRLLADSAYALYAIGLLATHRPALGERLAQTLFSVAASG